MTGKEILELLRRSTGFDWGKGNVNKNWSKHQVKDKESEEVFFNLPLAVSLDEKHSTKAEKRFQALGKTNQEKKLFIVFTIRDNRIRIISARKQNQKERGRYKQYEKQKA